MRPTRLSVFFEWLAANILDLLTIIVSVALIARFQSRPPLASDINAVASGILELATGILAVLAINAVSGLWDRNRRLGRIEGLVGKTAELAERNVSLGQENKDLIQQRLNGKPLARDFFGLDRMLPTHEFEAADTIWLSGITLTRTTKNYMQVLIKRVTAGAKIRVILLDPKADAVLDQLRQRSTGDLPVENWRNRLNLTVETIETIAKLAATSDLEPKKEGQLPAGTGVVEIGFLPYIPSFGLTMIDPDQGNGCGIIELYHHRSLEPNAMFELRANEDKEWFSFFKNQHELLWQSCRREYFIVTDDESRKTITSRPIN